MDTLLIAVTLVSLGLAGAMSLIVARLLREERKRSEARVAALRELASAPTPAARRAGAGRPAPSGDVRIRQEPLVDDLDLRPTEAPVAPDLFAQPERSSSWIRRLAVVGALAMIGGVIVFALALRVGSDRTGIDSRTSRSLPEAGTPLELVALRHTQDHGGLTVTGVVRNPKDGAHMERITATAVAFSPDGTFLAGAKAPLDYTSLTPGAESPFVITVPVREPVARYRVGFRTEDGSVVAHVDGRTHASRRAGL